jgi:rubrerythrin
MTEMVDSREVKMDIISTAIAFEKEGESFYWELADKTENRGIKNICLMLARDESEHIKVLEKLGTAAPAVKPASTIVEDSKKVFGRFIGDIFDPDEPIAEESLYLKAMELEKKTMEYYSARSSESKVTEAEKLYDQLAGEERKHYEILKSILEFRKNSKEWIGKRIFDRLEE